MGWNIMVKICPNYIDESEDYIKMTITAERYDDRIIEEAIYCVRLE